MSNRISCSYGSVYIGTTKRSINTRIKEHKSNSTIGYTDKSVIAENALTQDDQTSGSSTHKTWGHP